MRMCDISLLMYGLVIFFIIMCFHTLKRLTLLTCWKGKSEKFTPNLYEFTLRNFGYVTNGIRAQVATLGPLWVERKSEGTIWIK